MPSRSNRPSGSDEGWGARRRRGRLPAAVLALAGFGALWGAASYAVLWGYSSLVVTRRFVESASGLVSLLPVRALLFLIHILEGLAGRSFDFSRNHDWIGLGAAGLGAALVGLPALLVVTVARRVKGRDTNPGKIRKAP